MTETITTRIRWHDEAKNSMAALTGSIGILDPAMFHIWRPDAHCAEWQLTTRLHGMEQKHFYGDDPDELKAEAERWLTEFVTSLGASFEPGPAKPSRAWHADWAMDSRDQDGNAILRHKPSGGLYRVLPVEES